MKTMDGGTHINYVVEFCDGSVKVGVTSRPAERMKELARPKGGALSITRRMTTPAITKELAFKVEGDLCRLLGYAKRPGTREWFDSSERTGDEFWFLEQTTGMLWLQRTGLTYEHLVGSVA